MTVSCGFQNGIAVGQGLKITQNVATHPAYQPVFRRYQDMFDLTDHVYICSWPGSPEGNMAADTGSICMDSLNGALYIKTTDTATTGWLLLATSTGGTAIDSINIQATTAPGVSPVDADGTGLITINGASVAASSVPVQSRSIALNSLQIEVQRSSAQAVSTVNANGLAHFNSAQFTVDANGFVSSLAGTVPWLDSVGGALANHTGYFATAAAAYTLPAGAANGDMVEIVDSVGGGVVVTAQGGDLIRIGNVDSSVNGTSTSSILGDALRLVFRAVGQVWVQCPGSQGNWILA